MERCFDIHVQYACEDWTDYNLYRHSLHDVTITHYRESGAWEGQIRIAKTEEADFGEGRQIPSSIVEKLVALILR